MWHPSDPMPDVYPQLAKLSASLSVVVVKAELPASRSWSLLNATCPQSAFRFCVKTFMDKTLHCFSSAFCFWNFPDISWTIRLLCVATAWWRAYGVGVGESGIQTGARMFIKLVPIVLRVWNWGLRCWHVAQGIALKRVYRLNSFLGSPIVPWLRTESLG